MEGSLKKALISIGISEKERIKRGMTFHGWRHWLNTTLRASGVKDSKVMAVTGHKSKQIMDHYTSFRKEDFEEVIKVQNALWKQPTTIGS